jgi:predicted permease
MKGGVPRGWRAVLRRVVPVRELDATEGELAEGFALRAQSIGETAARWWYRRQVVGFALRAVAVRGAMDGGEKMGGLSEVTSDVRWALRGLKRRPTFTAVAVATLALGIGSNSAIFTLVNAHFLAPLPYGDPDGLVLLWETGRNDLDATTVAPGNYYSWRERTSSLADIAAFNVDQATLSGDGTAEAVTASVVTPHFFDVLGVSPALGSGFSEEAARAADAKLAILGHALWTRRYGGDPGVVGRDIRIDGQPHTVVGVMPPHFRQPERSLSWQTAQVWRPILLDDQRDDYSSRYLRTVARIESGFTVDEVREEMRLLAGRLRDAQPIANAGRRVLVVTLDDYLMGAARPTLFMLLVAGIAVLLIVCANVANLTLARGEERRREFALRAALGSGRGRLLRQLLVEGVVLALGGAVLGTLLVFQGRGLLQSVQAEYFSGLVDVAVDWRVVAFTVALAVASGALFGLPLARSAARAQLRDALVEGGERLVGGRGSGPTRNLLIVGQVAIATTLLVVATLLSRSFNELVNVPPGFEAEGVVTFSAYPPRSTYPDQQAVTRYHQELVAEIERIPGVREVGLVSDMPFTTSNWSAGLEIAGLPYDPADPPTSEFHVVIPEYFEVMGIPLLSGTMPQGAWEIEGEVPVLINERLAERYWADTEPLGASFRMDWNDSVTMRVAGVVGNVLDDGFSASADPVFYVPFGGLPNRGMAYVVGTVGDPAEIVGRVREAVARLDPDIPAADLRLLESMMAETVTRPQAASLIGVVFAFIALLVSAAGIYGVLSYSVQSRTREIGIRSALGADRGQLMSMVMRSSTRLVAVGLALGLFGALAAGSALRGLLFGVRAWDPVSLVLASLVLGSVASFAAWLPARRAVSIDPKEALRTD